MGIGAVGFRWYATPHGPGSCLDHRLSPTDLLLGLLGPAAWGGFRSVLRNPLQTDPCASPSPGQAGQALGGPLALLRAPPSPSYPRSLLPA